MEIDALDVPSLTREEANQLWARVKDQRPCFDDFSFGRADIFASRISSPSTVAFICEAGLVTIEGIAPMLNGFMHCFLFEKIPYSEIAEAGRSILRQVFSDYDLHRVTAMLPETNKFAMRAAVDIGFKYEGTIRQSWLSHGEFYDVHVYGILRSEFEEA